MILEGLELCSCVLPRLHQLQFLFYSALLGKLFHLTPCTFLIFPFFSLACCQVHPAPPMWLAHLLEGVQDEFGA